jgi:hypothetical protein
MAVAVIAFVFQFLKYRSEESGADKSSKKLKVLNFNILKALRDTAGSVGAGMAVVCVAQLLLRTLFVFVNPQTVRALEDWVVSKRASLTGLLQFKWLLLTLTVLVIAALIWPSTKPVSRYREGIEWRARGAFVGSPLRGKAGEGGIRADDGLQGDWARCCNRVAIRSQEGACLP